MGTSARTSMVAWTGTSRHIAASLCQWCAPLGIQQCSQPLVDSRPWIDRRSALSTQTPHADCKFLFLQVMDPKKTTNEKVRKERKPDHTLISFFGDDSYGWFPKGRDIIPFDKNYSAKSKQPASKKVHDSSLRLLDMPVLAVPYLQKHVKLYNPRNKHSACICNSHSQVAYFPSILSLQHATQQV